MLLYICNKKEKRGEKYMIRLIIGIGFLASLFWGAYFHDKIYLPYSQHLERSQELFNDQKQRQYEKPSIQKMNSKTFISTYPLMKEFLNIFSPFPYGDIYCYSFKLLNPEENKVYFLTFNFADYWKVHKFCNKLKKMKEQELKDKEKIKNHADEVEMYKFLQSLCQDKMKQAQKEIEVACDDIKKITLKVNGAKED